MIRFRFKISPAYLDDPKHPITIPIEFRGDLFKSGLKETTEVSLTWPNGQSSEAVIYPGQRPAVEGGEQYPYYQIRVRTGGFRSSLIEGLQPSDTIDVEIRPEEGFKVILQARRVG